MRHRPPIVRRAVCALAVLAWAAAAVAADPAGERVALGRALFFDADLSRTRTQSCASCHDPARAFSDGRDGGIGAAASRGADGTSLGTRNAPTLTYAALVPPRGRDDAGIWLGGLFHDGRASDLADQAGQPMLNPLEMQMADAAAVVARVREKKGYVDTLERLHGAGLFDDEARAFAAIRAALAAYERTPEFLAFDSRYDRAVRGEATLTEEEEQGRTLFFSSLTNCSECHQLERSAIDAREPFTSFRYFNIGIPANPRLRAGAAGQAPDRGLGAVLDDAREDGKFRVPTLRNIAVTAPYMHNGVFARLETAVFFYNQYLVDNPQVRVNPETGQPWGPAEVPATVAHDRLRLGQPLDTERIAALVAFLRTLTDRRFEVTNEN